MRQLNRKNVSVQSYPERIIQFGEGNFLRAFVDWIVFNMNRQAAFNSSVVVVQPIENGMVDMLNSQDGLYHLNLQGVEHGKVVDSVELIDVISRGLNPYKEFSEYLKLAENPEIRFVVSNTTEAGITFDPSCSLSDKPAASYPGKLTQLLYHRFNTFQGSADKGLIIFPCELIFHNGVELKACIEQYIELWQLGDDFKFWFENSCGVYSTLVDRIVPGYPKDDIQEILNRIQFEDKLVVKGEIFHLWVIEAPKSVAKEFPADKAGLNVLFVDNEKPYHERKVTLLNGPHMVLAPVGYLSGFDTVKECVEDSVVGSLVRQVIFDELMPTLNLPADELIAFANAVLERFQNPYVKHFVTSIMLNAFPKFKTRNIPGLKIYVDKNGSLPDGLVLGLAAICTYYKGGKRNQDIIDIKDDPEIVMFLQSLWATGSVQKVAEGVLAADIIWGEDLNQISGLTSKLATLLLLIQREGMLQAVKYVSK